MSNVFYYCTPHFLVRRTVQAANCARFLAPNEPGGLPRLFGDTPVAALSGMTLILEVTPAAETVVTPCNVVRRLLASVVVDSIFLRGALFGFGMGITSTPPSRLTFFALFLALARGFDPVCLSNIARLAGVRGFAGGSVIPGELGRGGAVVVALVSTLLDRSLALEDGALVDGALVVAEASERGARPRGNTGAVGRGAGVGAVGSTTAAPGAVLGASGRTVGAAIGGKAGVAFGGGKAGGFAIPEFQGATLAAPPGFTFLL